MTGQDLRTLTEAEREREAAERERDAAQRQMKTMAEELARLRGS